MRHLIRFLWLRYWLGCSNITYGRCGWGGPYCEDHRRRWYVTWFGLDRVVLLADEGMCHSCYWSDYVIHYK